MHISIIDDEKVLTSRISKKLKLAGYLVSEFYSYTDFMTHGVHEMGFDLYLIDISLGDGSGFDIVKFLRTQKKITTPIIIMSAFGDAQNKVFGLDIGADDYITKPIIPEELLARLRAKLRRKEPYMDKTMVVSHNNITVNIMTQDVYLNGQKIFLTPKEYRLLEFFLKHIGKLISRQDMLLFIWGAHDLSEVSDNTINATISKLKKKLAGDFNLQVKYNSGYILE